MKYTLKTQQMLIDAVMEAYKGISRNKAKSIIMSNRITINGKDKPLKAITLLESGDIIEFFSKDKTMLFNAKPTRSNPIVIYYEDEFMVVARKPAGILACGDKNDKVNYSFHKNLEQYLTRRDDKSRRLFVVHRIDREVEGLIIFAKSMKVQKLFKDIWPTVTKKYLALTEGKPEVESGVIENYLKDGLKQKVFAYDHEIADSRFAKTEYKYLRDEKGYSVIEVMLHTGRKNQIRVHLADMGCPIVGDRKYGAKDDFKRQIRLAAFHLDFKHPVTEKQILMEYEPSINFFRPSKTADENYKVM